MFVDALAIGLVASGLALAAPTATDVRELAAFDEVVWNAVGELRVEQSHRERLTIEAEPAVLTRIVAEVKQRRLEIGFKPGAPIRTEYPIRFRLETRQLAALETRGSGSVRIAALTPSDTTKTFRRARSGASSIRPSSRSSNSRTGSSRWRLAIRCCAPAIPPRTARPR